MDKAKTVLENKPNISDWKLPDLQAVLPMYKWKCDGKLPRLKADYISKYNEWKGRCPLTWEEYLVENKVEEFEDYEEDDVDENIMDVVDENEELSEASAEGDTSGIQYLFFFQEQKFPG